MLVVLGDVHLVFVLFVFVHRLLFVVFVLIVVINAESTDGAGLWNTWKKTTIVRIFPNAQPFNRSSHPPASILQYR